MPPDLTDPCADFQPQLAAYALGETDADTDMLAHLAGCPACQRDLRAYIQIARVLPYDAPDVAPSPGLRERILAAATAAEPAPAAPPPVISPPAARPAPSGPRRWRMPALWPALAFAAAMVVVLLGWNLSLQNQLDAQTGQIAASRENWRTMIVLLNDPAVHWYPVGGDQAQGHFWANPRGDVACLVAQRLPALDRNQVYQVWLLRGTKRTSGGVFEARDGDGWILIRPGELMANYDAVGVTVEPRGGSAAPTGQTVLHGSLASAQEPSSSDRQGALSLLEHTVEWGR